MQFRNQTGLNQIRKRKPKVFFVDEFPGDNRPASRIMRSSLVSILKKGNKDRVKLKELARARIENDNLERQLRKVLFSFIKQKLQAMLSESKFSSYCGLIVSIIGDDKKMRLLYKNVGKHAREGIRSKKSKISEGQNPARHINLWAIVGTCLMRELDKQNSNMEPQLGLSVLRDQVQHKRDSDSYRSVRQLKEKLRSIKPLSTVDFTSGRQTQIHFDFKPVQKPLDISVETEFEKLERLAGPTTKTLLAMIREYKLEKDFGDLTDVKKVKSIVREVDDKLRLLMGNKKYALEDIQKMREKIITDQLSML